MGFEKPDKNPYEPLLRASDGHLVKESELAKYEANLNDNADGEDDVHEMEHEEDEPEEKPSGVSRRTFLKGLGGAAAVAALGGTGLFDDIDFKGLKEKVQKTVDNAEEYFEQFSSNHTLIEQLLKHGEVKDLHVGIEAVKEKHLAYLTQTEDGRDDMHKATRNLRKLDLDKFTRPFRELGLPPQLCYMIAIQETRARDLTSWAGARGHMGIMPGTAKAYGYPPEAAHNPYLASKIAARYCEDERKRFGNQGDMILHAYNGGGGLFGFTERTPKEDRTPENFYHYMEEHINSKLLQYEKDGYIPIKVRKKDTLYGLSKKFGVRLQDMLNANGLTEQSIIREGQDLKVPFERNPQLLEIVLRKELEVLRYTPEVKAKYEALQEHGFLAQIESGFQDISQTG